MSAARVESYRGFVFSSKASNGPNLEEFLGPMKEAIDNLIDRAPGGNIFIKGGNFRVKYPGNWKLHHYFEDDKIELYDLNNDLTELNDLSEINKEKKDELYDDLLSWRKQNKAPIPSRLNPDYDQLFVDSLNHLIVSKKIRGKVNKNEY